MLLVVLLNHVVCRKSSDMLMETLHPQTLNRHRRARPGTAGPSESEALVFLSGSTTKDNVFFLYFVAWFLLFSAGFFFNC